MKLEQRIYCIEGQWNWGKKEVEPSVEPILQLLQKMGQWNYARRDCATLPELQFWLKHEWNTRCTEGSILYIASHGSEGRIWLTYENKDNESISLHQLADGMLDCTNCLVHFSGCNIIAAGAEDMVRAFMDGTGATCVTGYGAEVGWADTTFAPAVALELMVFSSISVQGISFDDRRKDGKNIKALKNLIKRFNSNEIFKECGLGLCTKWD